MRTKLALVLAAAAALAAGCGGSGRLTERQFEDRIQNDGSLIEEAIARITSDTSSMKQLAKQVDAAEQTVRKAVDDLDAAKPPENAELETKTIVAALREIDRQLVRLAQAAKRKDPLAAQRASTAIQTSPKIFAAQSAISELQRKGYDIGVLGT